MGLYISNKTDSLLDKNQLKITTEPSAAGLPTFGDANEQGSSKAIKKVQYSALQFLFLQKKYSEVSNQGICFLQNFELDCVEKGNIHHLISYAFYHLSAYKLSIKHGKEAVIYFDESKDIVGLAKVHTTLAAAYRKIHKYYKASQHLKLSLDIKKKSSSFSEIAIALTLNHLGDFHCYLEEYGKALIYYHQAEKIYKRKSNYFRYAAILNRLGLVYRKLENHTFSWRCISEAYRISYKNNYSNILFLSYINLGHFYYEKGQYQRTIKLLGKARGLSGKVTLNVKSFAEIFPLLSKSYLKVNHVGKALQIGLEGLGFRYKYALRSRISLYENIIKCYHRQEDFKNCFIYQQLKEKSILELHKKQTIFKRNKNKYQQKEVLAKKEQSFHQIQEKEKELLWGKINESRTYLDEFVNLFVHDVKAPIRHIQGFSDLLSKKLNHHNSYSEYLNIIHSSSKDLSAIVDSLYSYATTGVDSNPMDFIQMDSVLKDIEIMVRKIILKKQIKITLNINHLIYSEKSLLLQLLQHLIQNAILYAKDDVLPEINIFSEATKDNIILTCSDNGIGLNQLDQKIIFLPFSKTSHFHKQGTKTGIGLATCLKIMEKHNGKILVESEVGVGTAFKMFFPIPKKYRMK